MGSGFKGFRLLPFGDLGFRMLRVLVRVLLLGSFRALGLRLRLSGSHKICQTDPSAALLRRFMASGAFGLGFRVCLP